MNIDKPLKIKKDHPISVRFKISQHERMSKCAEKHHMKIAGFIKKVILDYIDEFDKKNLSEKEERQS